MSQEATQPEVAAPVEETVVSEPSVPKKPKRTLTDKQRAALQQGRNKRWEKHNALVNSLKDKKPEQLTEEDIGKLEAFEKEKDEKHAKRQTKKLKIAPPPPPSSSSSEEESEASTEEEKEPSETEDEENYYDTFQRYARLNPHLSRREMKNAMAYFEPKRGGFKFL
jgi:hypothetical protein